MQRPTVEIQGYALRVIRECKGRKQADLAEAVGINRTYLTKIEVGRVVRVSETVYSAILRELGIQDHRALLASPPARADLEEHDEPSLATVIAAAS